MKDYDYITIPIGFAPGKNLNNITYSPHTLRMMLSETDSYTDNELYLTSTPTNRHPQNLSSFIQVNLPDVIGTVVDIDANGRFITVQPKNEKLNELITEFQPVVNPRILVNKYKRHLCSPVKEIVHGRIICFDLNSIPAESVLYVKEKKNGKTDINHPLYF